MFTFQKSPAEMQPQVHTTTVSVSYPAKFRLLSLPLELRRNVYHFYFTSTLGKYDSQYRLIQADQSCNIYCLKQCHTQILTVNRQLHAEARDVLYNDTIWHISFNSFAPQGNHTVFSDASLQAFRSQPEFRFIQNITIGVMFHPVMKPTLRTQEIADRLRVNRQLLRTICATLTLAPNLKTLKLFWHDEIEHFDRAEKRDCLRAVAELSEKVRCMAFLGSEAMAEHFPPRFVNKDRALSVQEHAAKAGLNQYINSIRQQGYMNVFRSTIKDSSVPTDNLGAS